MSDTHTKHPLTYEVGPSTGNNWQVAQINRGPNPETGELEIGRIVTDGVHASELVFGDFEADLRMWSASTRLYEALRRAQAALAFASSVIKSGEPWTATCDDMIGGAMEHADAALSRATQTDA